MEFTKRLLHMEKEDCAASSQFVLEEDLIIPDSRPDVLRVLLYKSDVIKEEQRILENHIIVKGRLNYCILYRAKDDFNVLSYVKGDIPFEEQLFMDGIQNSDEIESTLTMEDQNINMINSRKLNLHALLSICAVRTTLYDEEITTSLEADESASCSGCETRQSRMDILELSVLKKDICRIREELELPKSFPNIAELLWSRVDAGEMEIRPLDDKLSIKTTLSIFLIYRSDSEDSVIRYYETSIPYSTTVECDRSDDAMIPAITYNISHCETEVRPDFDGEERVLGIELILDLSIRLYQETDVAYLFDVYGTTKELSPVTKQCSLKKLNIYNLSQYKLSTRLALAEDAPPILQLCYCNTFLKTDDPKITDGGIEVCGLLELQVLYLTGDDDSPYYSYTESVPFSHTIEVPDISYHSIFHVRASLDQTNVTLPTAQELEVKSSITFQTFVYEQVPVELITDVVVQEMDPARINSMPSIIVYFVKEGESLWQIGKNYSVPIASIMEQNEMTSENIQVGDRLFIVK
ncbi:MAG TPA: DUF3794 domain-containing protein [Lachnospiraceae bacterium]|nr:DUF3794 domain-containing protein [Lachnospiraceae bacterium]HPF28769.1 DUF3794 domain-containing protein [Lachnospiraceae bacterium]